MAELTSKPSPNIIFGTKAGSKSCKLPSKEDTGTNPLNPIYIKYKDHAFFKNLPDPVAAPVIRETIGWVKEENEELFLIETDRSVPRIGTKVNGTIILKNCIIEAYPLPLQKKSEYHLNLKKTTSKLELAFRTSERKTHGAISRKNQT